MNPFSKRLLTLTALVALSFASACTARAEDTGAGSKSPKLRFNCSLSRLDGDLKSTNVTATLEPEWSMGDDAKSEPFTYERLVRLNVVQDSEDAKDTTATVSVTWKRPLEKNTPTLTQGLYKDGFPIEGKVSEVLEKRFQVSLRCEATPILPSKGQPDAGAGVTDSDKNGKQAPPAENGPKQGQGGQKQGAQQGS